MTEATPTTGTIHEKLVVIQSELKAPKGQTNSFGGYKYRNCEDILEALKPILKENGCTLMLSDDIVMLGSRFYVKSTATMSEGSGNVTAIGFAREAEIKKGMDEAQITGSASSYARKYALNGLFCIDDTKDADATNDQGKNATAKPTAPKPAPQPARQEERPKTAPAEKPAVIKAPLFPHVEGDVTLSKEQAAQAVKLWNDLMDFQNTSAAKRPTLLTESLGVKYGVKTIMSLRSKQADHMIAGLKKALGAAIDAAETAAQKAS
jgi:hypothetical protein